MQFIKNTKASAIVNFSSDLAFAESAEFAMLSADAKFNLKSICISAEYLWFSICIYSLDSDKTVKWYILQFTLVVYNDLARFQYESSYRFRFTLIIFTNKHLDLHF